MFPQVHPITFKKCDARLHQSVSRLKNMFEKPLASHLKTFSQETLHYLKKTATILILILLIAPTTNQNQKNPHSNRKIPDTYPHNKIRMKTTSQKFPNKETKTTTKTPPKNHPPVFRDKFLHPIYVISHNSVQFPPEFWTPVMCGQFFTWDRSADLEHR